MDGGVYTQVCSMDRSQERVSGPLKLELQVVVSHPILKSWEPNPDLLQGQ